MCSVFQNTVLIKTQNDRVLVGTLNEGALVGSIEAGGTFFLILHEALWLSCTANTAGRTGHDLDKIKVLLTAFNEFNQSIGISETADNSRLYVLAADVEGKFLYTVKAAVSGLSYFL